MTVLSDLPKSVRHLWLEIAGGLYYTCVHSACMSALLVHVVFKNVCLVYPRVWPAVMFFAVVFGVPWLIWKLLSALCES